MTLRNALRDPALLAIVVAGAALRVLVAADHSRHLSADARAYSMLGAFIADRGRYGGPGLSGPFHWPPGAPMLFASAHILGLSPYVAQVVVGTLTIAAAAWVAWPIAGRAAGLLAAGVVALYPPLVLSTAELLSEPLGALLLTLSVVALGAALHDGRALTFAPCGVLLGLTVLTRADLLFAPLVVAGVVLALRRSPRPAAAVLVAAALTVAPWTIFVATKKHEFVPVSTGGGSNLFIGTYLPGHGTIFGLKKAYNPVLQAHRLVPRGTPDFRVREETILHYVARGHHGNGQDAYLRNVGLRNARHFLTHRPVAFVRMLGSKVGRLWLDYTHGTLHRSRTLPRVGHILLMLLALVALALGLRAQRAGELVCIATLLVLATVVNAVLVSEARHLLPLLPLLFAGAAVGIVLTVRGRSGTVHNPELSMTRP